MTRRPWRWAPGLAALALAAVVGGSQARASLQTNLILTVQQTGSAGINPTLTITDGLTNGTNNGTFTFTGGLANSNYSFTFYSPTNPNAPGTVESFTTNGSGSYTAGQFNTTNVDGLKIGDGSFGNFNILSVTATRVQSAQDSYINDVNADVSREPSTQTSTLKITTAGGFSQPATPTVVLQSSITGLITGDTNATVALNSNIGTTNVGVTASQATPSLYAYNHATPGGNPYIVTSTITINQLGDGSANNKSVYFDARTDVYAAPEPATIVMGAIAFPLVILGARLRRNKAQS